MTLSEILEKAPAVEQIASSNPRDGDFRTTPGREAAKNRAGVELIQLQTQYVELLKTMTTLVFVKPSDTWDYYNMEAYKSEFMNKVLKTERPEDSVRPIVYDMSSKYQQMVRQVGPTIGKNNEFTANQLFTLRELVKRWGMELNLMEMGAPGVPVPIVVDDFNALTNVIRRAIRHGNNDSLVMAETTKSLFSIPWASKEEGSSWTVFVVGATQEEFESFKTHYSTCRVVDMQFNTEFPSKAEIKNVFRGTTQVQGE